jgi:subtilase family serine protease
MRLSRYAITVSAAALLAASAGGACADAGVRLGGHVAKWVAKGHKVGAADDGQPVRMAAFLGFRNAEALRQLIARQSTPGSADYNHYLTAEQFHQRFSPSARDEAKVENGLRALGFEVTGKPVSNLYVEFTGTVAQVKSAFAVSQNLYSFGGKVMRANAEDPSLPASLKGLVKVIEGLDDTGQLIHPFHVSINGDRADGRSARATPGGASPSATLPVAGFLPSPYCSTYFGDTVATLSTTPSPYAAKVPWLACSYDPQKMRAAYGADKSPMDGTGVTVAIVDAYVSPTLEYDANRYSKNHGLPKVVSGSNLQIIYEGNIKKVSNDDPCGPQGWFGEISLDVDAVHAMAPGADILYSGGLSCSSRDLDTALYTVIDGTKKQSGPLAAIVSNSYGYSGEPLSDAQEEADTAIYQQGAAEGVSILFASGDHGDVAAITGTAEASWPAASPLVTGVGGTSLALEDAKGKKSEWGWGTFRAYLSGAVVNSATSVTDTGVGDFAFYSGAGGGPSFKQGEPSYQVGVVPTKLTKRTYDLNGDRHPLPQNRVVPDIAMDADPYTGFLIGESYTIAGDPVADAGCTPKSKTEEYCEAGIGGTSLASPLFAGTLALAVQQRHANGLGDLGQVNARLYGLKVGEPGSTTTPLADVQAPKAPTAVLRGYVNDLNTVRLVAMNSSPGPVGPLCTTSFCNGQDSWILQTKPKYDDVTGVGAPYIPAFIASLGVAP